MHSRGSLQRYPSRRCIAMAVPGTATAQANYPAGPLRIVSPYPPGGGTDILSRVIGQKLNENLKQPVVVENRAGANGTIGAAFVAKSTPDGLTMLIVPAGYAANPALYKSLPYDQARDLAPVSHLASGPLVLVVHPSLPAKSVKEFIALAKSRPGEINVGSAGNGSLPHLCAELFNSAAGVRAHPYSVQRLGCGHRRCVGRPGAGLLHEHSAKPAAHQGRQAARARRHQPATFSDRAGPAGDCAGRSWFRHDELVRAPRRRRHAARVSSQSCSRKSRAC